MSTKSKGESDFVTKKHKWLTLEQNLNIIKLHEKGASFAKIGREKGMDESSVWKLIKNKDQYKSQSMATASYLSKIVTKTRSTRMVNMERLLSIWSDYYPYGTATIHMERLLSIWSGYYPYGAAIIIMKRLLSILSILSILSMDQRLKSKASSA